MVPYHNIKKKMMAKKKTVGGKAVPSNEHSCNGGGTCTPSAMMLLLIMGLIIKKAHLTSERLVVIPTKAGIKPSRKGKRHVTCPHAKPASAATNVWASGNTGATKIDDVCKWENVSEDKGDDDDMQVFTADFGSK